jgi:hypothetical protein
MPPENDDKSTDDKPAVTFKSEGEFLAAVAKKTEKAVRAAVEKAKADLLGSLGAEGEDDLSALKAKLDSSKATVTEAEKLKGENGKLAKQIRDLEKANGELAAYRSTTLKRSALMPFAGRTVDKTGETLVDLLGPRLQISDDGTTVTGPDGAKLEDVVNGLLETRPFLKAPDWKQGAGTGPKPKTDANAAAGGNGQDAGGQPKNGAAATVAPTAQLAQAMARAYQDQSGGGGGVSGP